VPEITTRASLGERGASQLANVTKTPPIFQAITPRWIVRLLDWKPLEAGIFRRNRVVEDKPIDVVCSHTDESIIPGTYAEYEETPREYVLSSINAIVNIDTRVGDLFSKPYDQVREQLRVTIEAVKERQENELLNNADYGLLNNVSDSQRISTRTGAPTPDDLDELLTKVWKEPSFFIANPRAIAAFGRECTRRGVPPPTVTLFGNPFLTWRGIPLIPTDKVHIAGEVPKSQILLIRVGERKQGVVGLFQPGLTGEQSPGLSVRFKGISDAGLASYLISLYCSASVLADDAIAVLDDVEVGQYYEYK
jgi:Phage capsid-like protein